MKEEEDYDLMSVICAFQFSVCFVMLILVVLVVFVFVIVVSQFPIFVVSTRRK